MKILGSKIKVKRIRLGNMGESWLEENLILIRKDLPKCAIDNTVCHEIIEHINFKLELGLSHPQINALAQGLCSCLPDGSFRRLVKK